MLSELVWYINQDPPPPDKEATSEVLAYLEACSQLFERGFLSHSRVRSLDGDVIQNIDKGFKYFTAWISSILDKRKIWFANIFTYNRCNVNFQAHAQLFNFYISLTGPDFPHTASTQKSFLSWQSKLVCFYDTYNNNSLGSLAD